MIKMFRGEYDYLSNFFLRRQVHVFAGYLIEYGSNEHFYAAAKASNMEDYMTIVQAPTPAIAKKMGSKKGYMMPNGVLFRIPPPPNWNSMRIPIMMLGLHLKFSQNEDLLNKLVATHPKHIQEGNWWGDLFWGVDVRTGEGENNLGKLLMDLRSKLLLTKSPVINNIPV